jgi:hypothetical protein
MEIPNRAVWNDQFKYLKSILLKSGKTVEALDLCLRLHAKVHASEMSYSSEPTFEDALWQEMDEPCFRTRQSKDHWTILMNIWHVTRIEDMTLNFLVAERDQVISGDHWMERISSPISDTGNAMTGEAIQALSARVDIESLYQYRVAVGRRSRKIISGLSLDDLKTRIAPSGLERIWKEGGVVEDSRWLLDFWGKKNKAGILLMPATRHNLVHINSALRIKEICRK